MCYNDLSSTREERHFILIPTKRENGSVEYFSYGLVFFTSYWVSFYLDIMDEVEEERLKYLYDHCGDVVRG